MVQHGARISRKLGDQGVLSKAHELRNHSSFEEECQEYPAFITQGPLTPDMHVTG
jgi:hypothetical protein